MKPNELVICRDKYDNEDDFWAAVVNALKLLTENEYICTFRYEDCGVYVIEYDHEDFDLCNVHPEWLTADEIEERWMSKEDESAEIYPEKGMIPS